MEILAKSILSKVFECDLFGEYYLSHRVAALDYIVIPGNSGPRWIVPNDSAFASDILGQWFPYGLISKLKWKAILYLYKKNILALVPHVSILRNHHNIGSGGEVGGSEVAPIIYVGTPGPQQKAVVTLVEVSTKIAVGIIKIPISNGAFHSIGVEARALLALDRSEVKSVPKLISSQCASGCTIQTTLDGMLSPRLLTKGHVEWLTNLPVGDLVFSFDSIKIRLENLIKNNENIFLKSHLAKLFSATQVLSGGEVFSTVLAHGDFAPWNIKKNSLGLSFYDWEDAIFDGYPLWDLCHFYLIQGFLFGDKNSVENLISSKLVVYYLERLGINKSHLINFIITYMVTTIVDKNKNHEYSDFLLKNISRVINC